MEDESKELLEHEKSVILDSLKSAQGNISKIKYWLLGFEAGSKGDLLSGAPSRLNVAQVENAIRESISLIERSFREK